MIKNIVELSEKYGTDKKMNNNVKCKNGVYGHNYAHHYDKYLLDLKINTLLEIGVSWGASIQMWDEYFNKEVLLYGIDIEERRFKKSDIETENIKIFIGDQSNINFLETFENTQFDIIIDDGSHKMKDQQHSLKILFKYLKKGGLYIIEDLHSSNESKYYNSINETTTLTLLQSLNDKKYYNSHYINTKEYQYLLDNINIIHFHEKNNICFIFKK